MMETPNAVSKSARVGGGSVPISVLLKRCVSSGMQLSSEARELLERRQRGFVELSSPDHIRDLDGLACAVHLSRLAQTRLHQDDRACNDDVVVADMGSVGMESC